MNVRHEYLQNNYTLADSGEFVFDIGSNDVMTRLDVELKATNGATNNQANLIPQNITSIEIMDGSEVIISLSGMELAGLLVNRLGRFPDSILSEVPAVVQSFRYAIDFGRWYMDKDFALDASKFKNLQCRIKWNLATVTAVGATGFVTATAKLTVIAHVMEGVSSPFGYLSVKRHALFTTAASGEENISLPVDKVIRSVTVRSYEAGVGALSGISNVKVSGDEGKVKPLDMAIADYLGSLVNVYPPVHYRHDFHALDADTLFPQVKYREAVKLNTNGKDIIAQYVHADIGQGTVNAETASTAVALAVDTPMYGLVEGWLPFSCATWFFGDYTDPDTWLDATLFKSLRLLLEQNNAGASCSVVLEQVTTY